MKIETFWTDDAVADLTRLWAEGHTAKSIAETLGCASRCAVIAKASRIGLPGRNPGQNPLKSGKPATTLRFRGLPKKPPSRKEYAPSKTVALTMPHGQFKLLPRVAQMTKSQLRAELAQAVRNTAAMPVE